MEFTDPLKSAFVPHSVALVGASDRENSNGTFLWQSIVHGQCLHDTYPVNPKYKYLGVTPCWASLSDLPEIIDLAVIAVPSDKVIPVLEECVRLGIPNALITLGDKQYTSDRRWRKKLHEFSRRYPIRIIGPDSAGIMRPSIGLNVSYCRDLAQFGSVGLLCQSGSVTASMLDYAKEHSIGFSSVITSGAESDVTLAEIIHFLSTDPDTKIIAIHIESVLHPRELYSALREACQRKPVIVLKTGKSSRASELIASRTCCSAGNDALFDAMCRRLGIIRCERYEEFCGLLNLFTTKNTKTGPCLSILCNGLGYAALCADAAHREGIELARLNNKTFRALQKEVQPIWPLDNPIDIGTEASAESLLSCVNALLHDEKTDALMLCLASDHSVDQATLPRTLATLANFGKKQIFIAWMGAKPTAELIGSFREIGIVSFSGIDAALRAFAQCCDYEKIRSFYQIPPKEGTETDRNNLSEARGLIEEARAQNRYRLTEEQSIGLLKLFGIQSAKSSFASSAHEAVAVSQHIGFPVALKLCADGVAQKSAVGGVVLNCSTEKELLDAYDKIAQSCRTKAPMAKFRGVLVQEMYLLSPNDRRLNIRIQKDPVYGPAISIGIDDQASGEPRIQTSELLPLTGPIALDFVNRSFPAETLTNFKGSTNAIVDSLVHTLLNLSRMISELPCIVEIDINPLVIGDQKNIVLDSTIAVNSSPVRPDAAYSHMVICPAPNTFDKRVKINKGLLRLRTVRTDDYHQLQAFLHRLSERSLRMRFNKTLEQITHEELIHLTQIDYAREIALVATDDKAPNAEIRGVARMILHPNGSVAEFLLVVEDAFQNQRLGHILLDSLIKELKLRVTSATLLGYVLKDNKEMLGLLREYGFTESEVEEDPNVVACVKLLN